MYGGTPAHFFSLCCLSDLVIFQFSKHVHYVLRETFSGQICLVTVGLSIFQAFNWQCPSRMPNLITVFVYHIKQFIEGGHNKLLLECIDIQGDWTQMLNEWFLCLTQIV